MTRITGLLPTLARTFLIDVSILEKFLDYDLVVYPLPKAINFLKALGNYIPWLEITSILALPNQ
ncbi:hypothetical protein [Saccharolobus solfataricus]|uniref:hypothetical protein n=1 Tax=Saccharolobus solfataricus TaxID=2287 RepID=UPI0005FC3BB7|nr:hypothetical protein [Saccharolobus solfataricus]